MPIPYKNQTVKNRILLEIGILLIIACSVIFYQFNIIPHHLDFDEVDFARLALSLDRGPYTPFSPRATGHATLYFYIILLSFKLFGVTAFALRFPSAFFGVLNILVFYALMRLVNKKYAFAASILFATMRWYFSFARFAYEATFLLFLELASVYFLFRFFQKQKTANAVLFSLFTGLAFNSYTPGRIFFIAPFLLLVSLTVRGLIKKSNALIIAIVIFFITVLPLLSYLGTHIDPRLHQQFYLSNPRISLQQKIKYFKDGAVSTALMFINRGDFNGRHNYPGKAAINPLLALFFIIGLFSAMKNFRSISHQFFLLYFFVALVPTLLSYPHENPHMLRTFGAIPSVLYFISVGLNLMVSWIVRLPYGRYAAMIAIVYIIFLSSLLEVKTYFIFQRFVTMEAFEVGGELLQLVREHISRP